EVDADGAVEPLLNRLGGLALVAGLGIGRNQRLPFRLCEPKQVALGLGHPAVGVFLVVVFARSDDAVLAIAPQVRAVAADDETVGRRLRNGTLGRLSRRGIGD